MIADIAAKLIMSAGIVFAPRWLLAVMFFIREEYFLGIVAMFFAPEAWIETRFKSATVLIFRAVTGRELIVEKVVEKVVEVPVEKIVEKIVYRDRQVAVYRPDMSSNDAYDVIGAVHGADKITIDAKYRSILMKVHPDHGGSKFLTQVVNEARKLLPK